MIADKVKLKQIQSGNLTNKYEQVWYNGRFDKNTYKPNGLGKRFYSNGDTLIGEFKEGRPIKGSLYVLRDRRLYEGEFVDGLLEGTVN